MTSRLHANSPLSLDGRRLLIERCRTRPIAHVAAEMGISRATASKWVNRHRRFGDLGLLDRSSSPIRQPSATSGRLVEQIERLRREHRSSASRIAFDLDHAGTPVSRRTISRVLAQLGLGAARTIGPAGGPDRELRPRTADRPGQIVLLDAVRVSRIPDRHRGRVNAHARTEALPRPHAGAGRANLRSVFLHTAVDGYSALTYAEALPDDDPRTAIAFLGRAKAWFAARGITRIEQVVTGSGARYRAGAFRDAVIRRRGPSSPLIRDAGECSCADLGFLPGADRGTCSEMAPRGSQLPSKP